MRVIPMACMLAAGMACATLPASAQEHRQLGAHVHGHGHLNMAIEGKKLSMELEVPGSDIVGFEHEPSTPEQKAAVQEAKTKLANALVLFGPAQPAGCALDEVNIVVEAEHGEEHEHEHEAHDGAAGHADEAGHQHSEFHANYSMTCSSISKLTSLTLEYFNDFSGAQELDVSAIGPKGQSSFEIKRDKPTIDLAGIM
jgi:Protein of unknown function (DUF2796)